MSKQSTSQDLSARHRREGNPTPLGASVRAAIKKRLERIAIREDRSLDYIVDEMLRWAVEEYAGAGSLRGLLDSETDFSDQARAITERELESLRVN